MSRILAAGDRMARLVVGPAIALAFAVAPRMSRGTRPMPIDPSVQDGAPRPVRIQAPAVGAAVALRKTARAA